MSRNGREALPKVRQWFESPPKGMGVVRRPSWRSGSGRETLPQVREW